MRRLRSEGAFTLMETMVVVSVVGVLVSLILVAIGAARASARDARALSDLRQSAADVMVYAKDHDGLMPTIEPFEGMGAQRPVGITFNRGGAYVVPVFAAGRWWSWLLWLHFGEASETWRAGGAISGTAPQIGADDRPPTSGASIQGLLSPRQITMSDAFAAAPAFWTAGSPQLLADVGPQELHRTRSPSLKAMLFEPYELFSDNEHGQAAPGDGGVAFVDGSASIVKTQALRPGVENRYYPSEHMFGQTTALYYTEDGIHGRDR